MLFWLGCLFCTLTLGAAPGIQLEWSPAKAGGRPCEVEIDRGRLEKTIGIPAKHALAVEAVTATGTKTLPVKLLPGHDKDFQLLRFVPPAGTRSLALKTAEGLASLSNPAQEENLFGGVLAPGTLSRWSVSGADGAVTHDGRGILLQVKSANSCIFRTEVPVPAYLAGRPVRFELALRSLNAQRWLNLNRVVQLDGKGSILPGSAVDVRSISHLRPTGENTRYCVEGRLHPQTRRLRMELELRTPNAKFDRYGLPLSDKSALFPKLLVTELNLRPAETLPFPKWRNDLFPAGVSGDPADRALALGRDNAFYYVTTPRATWTEGYQIRSGKDCFFPVGDGTAECFFFAENNAGKGIITLFHAGNLLNDNHGNYLPVRRDLFSLAYRPEEKKLLLHLKDGNDRIFQREIPWTMPERKWFHCAVQWSEAGGVQLFLDGKKCMDAPEFSFAPIDFGKSKHPNALIAQVFTVGATSGYARRERWVKPPPDASFFSGRADRLRVSSCARYKGDFTPQMRMLPDDLTCAFFSFDRDFDGVSGGTFPFVLGDVTTEAGRRERYLAINGERVSYYPETLMAQANPAKVLNMLNFPVLPDAAEFRTGYRTHTVKVTGKPGETIRIDCLRAPVMDYIEYANDSAAPLRFPQLVNRGEIDARSFGDLADSLDLKNADPETRCRRLFNFFLASSDYFNTYQVDFAPGTDTPRQACYLALLMLNGYCGFECGPQNTMVAHSFAESALCPAMVTDGNGHVFEQVFYRGKNRLYDLATQAFYPGMDNSEVASLEELESEPGAFTRLDKGTNSFVRLTTRTLSTAPPDFPEKVGLTVRSGERLRMYYGNDGVFNDLHISRAFQKKIPAGSTDMTGEIHAAPNGWKWPICRVPRPFPEFGTGYLAFDGIPAEHAGTFCRVKPDSFCYQVCSGYPIVCGTYSAQLKDGSAAELELSTDRGRTFRPVPADGRGVCRLTYPVRARHELLLRVKAPLPEVRRWQAKTQVMTNPRVLPGKLHKGQNELTLKAVSGLRASVTVAYREPDRPMEIEGGVHWGTRVGFVRQMVLLRPGERAELAVRGAGPETVVRSGDGLRCSFRDGKLSVEAMPGADPRFEELTLKDRDVVKELTVLVSSKAQLLTAAQAVPLKNAEVVSPGADRVQRCLLLKDMGALGRFTGAIPAGEYAIWNLTRYPSHVKLNHLHRPLQVKFPDGRTLAVGSLRNWAVDFLKAEFGKPGARSRFSWDFPYGKSESFSLDRRPQTVKISGTDHLDLLLRSSSWDQVDGVEVAALLLMPPCSWEFTGEMMRMLCGLNSVPGRIRECERP